MSDADDKRARFRENWQNEVDSAAQYRAMAASEKDAAIARVYGELAAVEERHATFWEGQLAKVGDKPGARTPSWRARVLMAAARRFGASSILPTIAARESASRHDYVGQRETKGTDMPSQERQHARLLSAMLGRATGASGGDVARIEGRHRAVGGNALRAAVLGANDGLCSNLSLVMGVAGAQASGGAILVAGVAGLLAGAFSMALGEWLSMTSARELATRELRIEKDELEAAPEEERMELQLIYEAKGLAPDEAKKLSAQLVADPRHALDVLAREELGLDPNELGGSPLVAAATSFALFAVGAVVPVLPFLFLRGGVAVVMSIALSCVVLFGIGAAITVFTGRPVWRSGGRQLLLGLLAAGATFGLGRALGVALS